MRRVADWLTASRALIAVIIVCLSFAGKPALGSVVLLLILGWTTDVLDGRLARRSASEGAGLAATRIGEQDFTFDMIMVFSSLVYMALVGFVPLEYALLYTLLAAGLIFVFHSKSVTELLAFPIVALPLLLAYRESPPMAYLFVAWIIVALAVDWSRFTSVVGEFIQGMKRLRKSA